MCVLVSLMVGFYGKLRFSNIGTMFTQRGEVCNRCDVCEVKVVYSVASKERIFYWDLI